MSALDLYTHTPDSIAWTRSCARADAARIARSFSLLVALAPEPRARALAAALAHSPSRPSRPFALSPSRPPARRSRRKPPAQFVQQTRLHGLLDAAAIAAKTKRKNITTNNPPMNQRSLTFCHEHLQPGLSGGLPERHVKKEAASFDL